MQCMGAMHVTRCGGSWSVGMRQTHGMRRPTATARRWQLGQELRHLREGAGVRPADAAKEIGTSASTLSRIESGRQTIKTAYVRVLASLYEPDTATRDRLVALSEEAGQPEWHSTLSKPSPEWFRLFLGYEGSASTLSSYSAELVPGLLQTPEYVHAVLSVGRSTEADGDLDRTSALRLGRRRIITGDDPAVLHVVLNEAVLRRPIGGPDVMRDQLSHLAEMATQPHITIQVLPFTVGEHPAMDGSFTKIGFAGEWVGMNRVYLENGRGADLLDDTRDLDRYGWIFDALTRLALPTEKSRDLLVRVAGDL